MGTGSTATIANFFMAIIDINFYKFIWSHTMLFSQISSLDKILCIDWCENNKLYWRRMQQQTNSQHQFFVLYI